MDTLASWNPAPEHLGATPTTALDPRTGDASRGAQHLSALVLPTRADRMRIAHLRELADCRSEYLLDPGLASLEDRKDDAGIVMALLRDHEAIATIRFIPSGQGLTLTERFWAEQVGEPAMLGAQSWEVGRLIMAPEHRRADLLAPLLRLSLLELMQRTSVQHMHGSCLTRMTRLYRRFGFQVHAVRSHAGLDCALVHATVEASARAFRIDGALPAATRPDALTMAALLQ